MESNIFKVTQKDFNEKENPAFDAVSAPRTETPLCFSTVESAVNV